MDNKLLAVAGGQQPADIVIKNGKIVNVLTAEIYDGGVAIVDQTIAAVGDVDYCIGEGTQVVDAQGMFITPGFIDGHIHPESSDLAIRSFAEGVLKHGTTSIMTDLHEVGVVSGIEGIEAVLKENEATDLNLYFVVPSHVPFSPALETSGGSFNPEIIRKALQREDAVGISECVGPYILAGFPDLMESLDDVAGMKGMTGESDMRSVWEVINNTSDPEAAKRARTAMDVYINRLLKYVGSYAAELGGLDVITFTAGIGENDDDVRRELAEALAPFGVKIDVEANKGRVKEPRIVSAPDSAVTLVVYPTNEELAIARQALTFA